MRFFFTCSCVKIETSKTCHHNYPCVVSTPLKSLSNTSFSVVMKPWVQDRLSEQYLSLSWSPLDVGKTLELSLQSLSVRPLRVQVTVIVCILQFLKHWTRVKTVIKGWYQQVAVGLSCWRFGLLTLSSSCLLWYCSIICLCCSSVIRGSLAGAPCPF